MTDEQPKLPTGRGGARIGSGRKPGVSTQSDHYIAYTRARAKREGHLAKLAEFEVQQRAGELLVAADVLAQWQNIVLNVRARLLALPSRLAAQGHAARSRGELQRLLTEGINEALAELAAGNLDA